MTLSRSCRNSWPNSCRTALVYRVAGFGLGRAVGLGVGAAVPTGSPPIGAFWLSILRHRSAAGGSGRVIGSQQGSVLPLVWTRVHVTLYSHVLSHFVGAPPTRPPLSCSSLRHR